MYSERTTMCGASGLPHAQFQGVNGVVGGGTNMLPYYTDEYNNFVNIESPFEISLEMNVVSGALELTADVEVTGNVTAGDDNNIILIITHNYSSDYTCSVQRYDEFDCDLTNIGSTDTFTAVFDIDPNWQMSNLRGIAIIQKMDGSGSNYPIHQAAVLEYPLAAPNPIANQQMLLNETLSFDLTQFFSFQGNPVAADLSVQSSNSDIVEAILTDNELTVNSFDTGGSSQIDIIGEYNGFTSISSFIVFVMDPSVQSILIWDFDPTPTGDILKTSIENFYSSGEVFLTDNINSFVPNANTDAVFVLLGVNPNNYVLAETEAELLANYLDNGGNVYMEGGDTWYWDDPTVVHPYFKVLGLDDGNATLLNIEGHNFLEDLTWDYTGENAYIDQIYHIAPAELLFSNPDFGYNCGVVYDEGNYKTIGTSFEITGLDGENDLDDAVNGIIDFFGVSTGSSDNIIPTGSKYLAQNYPNPFNPETTIQFNLPEEQEITIEVFNTKGQKVKQLLKEQMPNGQHSVVWNGKDDTGKPVSSGIYFYRMTSGVNISTKKMILMK